MVQRVYYHMNLSLINSTGMTPNLLGCSGSHMSSVDFTLVGCLIVGDDEKLPNYMGIISEANIRIPSLTNQDSIECHKGFFRGSHILSKRRSNLSQPNRGDLISNFHIHWICLMISFSVNYDQSFAHVCTIKQDLPYCICNYIYIFIYLFDHFFGSIISSCHLNTTSLSLCCFPGHPARRERPRCRRRGGGRRLRCSGL